MQPKRRIQGLAIATLMTAGPVAAHANWDQVVERAKGEHSVVLYTSDGASQCAKENFAAFRTKYGIEVQVLAGRGSEVQERVRTEQASGRFGGDLYINGGAPMIIAGRANGLEPLGDIPNRKNLRPEVRDIGGDTFVAHAVPQLGMLINPRLVNAETELASWQDLTNPKWKGRILSDDLRVPGGGSVFFAVTHAAFGDDFHRKLLQNGIVWSSSPLTDGRRIAQGEYAIYVPQQTRNLSAFNGLPVRYWVPKEGVPYYGHYAAILAKAPHPNAARLLLNHMLDVESQANCANAGSAPSVIGVSESINEPFRTILSSRLLGTQPVDIDVSNATTAKAIEIYGK